MVGAISRFVWQTRHCHFGATPNYSRKSSGPLQALRHRLKHISHQPYYQPGRIMGAKSAAEIGTTMGAGTRTVQEATEQTESQKDGGRKIAEGL
jgi:hypothetical protein